MQAPWCARPLLHALPCLRQHLLEDPGYLVELMLGRNERRRDLDDGVAAVVCAADQALLEQARRHEALQQRLPLLVRERLACLLVLHQLERVEETRSAQVTDDRQLEECSERRPEGVTVVADIFDDSLALHD